MAFLQISASTAGRGTAQTSAAAGAHSHGGGTSWAVQAQVALVKPLVNGPALAPALQRRHLWSWVMTGRTGASLSC